MYAEDARLQLLALALAVGSIRNNSDEMRNLHPEARITVEQSAAAIQEVKIDRMRRDMGITGNTKRGIRYQHLKAGRWREAAVRGRDRARLDRRLARIKHNRKTNGYQVPTPDRDRAITREVMNGATVAEVGRRFGLSRTRIDQIVWKYSRGRPLRSLKLRSNAG